MKTIVALLILASTLAGCIVVPARPGYYYYPAPRYYRY